MGKRGGGRGGRKREKDTSNMDRRILKYLKIHYNLFSFRREREREGERVSKLH